VSDTAWIDHVVHDEDVRNVLREAFTLSVTDSISEHRQAEKSLGHFLATLRNRFDPERQP
jgi:hypothetical protein